MVANRNDDTYQRTPSVVYRRRHGQLPEIIDLSVMAGSGSLTHAGMAKKEMLCDQAVNAQFDDRRLELAQKVLVKLMPLALASHYAQKEAETERIQSCVSELAHVLVCHEADAAFWLVEAIVPYFRSIVAEAVSQLGEDSSSIKS